MKWYLGLAVAAMAVATSAVAQDFGAGDGHDWTGGYVGANISYTSTNSNAAFVPTSPYAAVPIESLPTGFTVGLQGGVNQQTGNLVFGVEGDVAFGSISQTYPDPLLGSPDTVTASSDVQGSVRGRLGLAIGNFLPYATAGIVAAQLKTSATNSPGVPLADEGIGYGWGAGLGVEVAIDESWSLRAEYLHSDIAAPDFYVGQTYENSAHPVSDSIRFGMNYRFQ